MAFVFQRGCGHELLGRRAMTTTEKQIEQLMLRLMLSHGLDGLSKSIDVAALSALLVVRAVQSMPTDIRQCMIENLTNFMREQVLDGESK